MRVLMIIFAVFSCMCSGALAQQDRIPPLSLYKSMADANIDSGWVSFREYDGKQWVYFTALVTLHCRLKEIRYSINTPDLDRVFPLPACHPALPFSLPPEAGPDAIAIVLSSGEAEKLAVQIVFDDDSESEVLVYEPCIGVGEATCAYLIE